MGWLSKAGQRWSTLRRLIGRGALLGAADSKAPAVPNPDPRSLIPGFDIPLPADKDRLVAFSHGFLMEPVADGLMCEAIDDDPFFITPGFEVDTTGFSCVRVTADFGAVGGHLLRVYFSTERLPRFNEQKSISRRIPKSAEPLELLFDFADRGWLRGQSVQLRFDLEHFEMGYNNSFVLQRVELLPWPVGLTEFRPPALPPRVGEIFHLTGRSTPSPGQTPTLQCADGLEILEGPHPSRLQGGDPVAWLLKARSQGRQAWSLEGGERQVSGEIWVRPDGFLTLCRQGPRALVVVPEVTLAFLTEELELRFISLPLTPCVDSASNDDFAGGASQFEARRQLEAGDVYVRLELRSDPQESALEGVRWRVKVTLPKTLRCVDLGLPKFLMVSDAEEDAHYRLMPGAQWHTDAGAAPLERHVHPKILAWPAAFVEQGSAFFAVSWHMGKHGRQVTPTLRVDGLGEKVGKHLLELRFPARSAHHDVAPPGRWGEEAVPFEVGGLASLTDAGRKAARIASLGLELLADLEGPPSELPEAEELLASSLRALEGPFCGTHGWTLTTLDTGQDEDYQDPRVGVAMLIAASRPSTPDVDPPAATPEMRVPETLLGAPSIPTLAQAMLMPSLLETALDRFEAHARELLDRQGADGLWPAVPVTGCVYESKAIARTAFAVATPCLDLLWAHHLGLVDAEAAVERAMAHLRRPDLVPTGGQFWEFAPEVADLRAIGKLASLFLLRGELDGSVDDLRRAADWLALGATFFHLEGGSADSRFGCIPALGVTRDDSSGLLWFQHAVGDRQDWRGVSCPWIGLRFGEAVQGAAQVLGRHGMAEEVVQLTSQLLQRTLTHAGQLRGPSYSLFDGYYVDLQVPTEPLHRAPVDLATQALGALGCPTTLAYAAHGGGIAAGVGRFWIEGDALQFAPSAARSQALLVRGPLQVGGGERTLWRNGLEIVRISGRDAVRLHAEGAVAPAVVGSLAPTAP